MVTATQSAHQRELGARLGTDTNAGLAGVFPDAAPEDNAKRHHAFLLDKVVRQNSNEIQGGVYS
jgi:hypothetical protein